MLTWVGKHALSRLQAFPVQAVERFDHGEGGSLPVHSVDIWKDWPKKYPKSGLLFYGENREVLSHLLTNGFRHSIKCVYIDPPFDSGADYVRKIVLRGSGGSARIEGKSYSLGEQIQYTDIWVNDNYLQFVYERLCILRELLREDGFIAVHMNTVRHHYLKVMMDEIYGADNFRNEIIIKRIRKSYVEANGVNSLNEGCDYILLYSKSPNSRMQAPVKEDKREERYHGFDAPGFRANLHYELFDKFPPPGRHWLKTKDKAEEMIKDGKLRPNTNTGIPEYRIEASDYTVRDTLWDDVTASSFTTGYPTEKKEQLLELLLGMTSNPGNIVLDCFLGSGTTAAVAQKHGRRWIGCDINKGAIQTASKRLNGIIESQASEERKNGNRLITPDGDPSIPAQLSFSVYRVNDYDLHLQHNEAITLVCEHIGIERIRTDSFFDGTLGNRLAKIVPFEHSITPLDLEEIEKELKIRPEEKRDIVAICLGKQIGAENWLSEYNKLRRPSEQLNRIEIIDLRSDPKYGKFFIHQASKAKVEIKRSGDAIIVDIIDFISPSIIERLKEQAPLFSPKIENFRAFIDSVMIDSAYNKKLFNAVIVDMPEKKGEYVNGHYEIRSTKKAKTNVAVKITDMLGEEVLISKAI